MASLRERRATYLIRNGFFKSEAIELSRTSRAGMRAPYFRFMVRSRKRLYDNAKRYKWTDEKYRDYVRQLYIDRGFMKPDKLGRRRVDVWALLRDYEERAFRRGEEYESPWRKKTRRKSAAKQKGKRTTQRETIKGWIKQLNRNIERATTDTKREKLIEQRAGLQRTLDSMGG